MAERAGQEINIIPLSLILKESKSVSVLDNALFSFKCPKNKDEENFLHNKAKKYETANKARTYLIYNQEYSHLLGYFTLAFKSVELKNISKEKRKRITAGEPETETYAAFLIGHLAKNNDYKDEIDGVTLLEEATSVILQAQDLVGGRLMYIDCKQEKKVQAFYENNGFVYFNTSKKTGLLQYYKKI